MMGQTVHAIFEDGSFRLVEPLDIPLREGQRVRLLVEEDESPDTILALAAEVYQGLSEQEIEELEQIALCRTDFFGDEQ